MLRYFFYMQKQTIDRADSAFHYVNTFNHKVILALETNHHPMTSKNKHFLK